MNGVVIGYGNMGQLHAAHWASFGQNIYVIEIDPKKQEAARQKGYQVHSSLEELTKKVQLHFAAICTPTHLHFEHIKNVMRHSIPLFVEKPIVRTAQEVNELRNLMYNHPVFVGEVEHYNKKLMTVIDAQDSPVSFKSKRSVDLNFFIKDMPFTPWFMDPNQSGGIETDLLIHDISLLVAKYGRPEVKEVFSQTVRYSCHDRVIAKLAFKNFEAMISSDWLSQDTQHPISVEWTFIDSKGASQKIVCNDYVIKDNQTIEREDPYLIQDQRFLDVVKSGTSSSLPYPTEVYLQAVEVANEITAKMN